MFEPLSPARDSESLYHYHNYFLHSMVLGFCGHNRKSITLQFPLPVLTVTRFSDSSRCLFVPPIHPLPSCSSTKATAIDFTKLICWYWWKVVFYCFSIISAILFGFRIGIQAIGWEAMLRWLRSENLFVVEIKVHIESRRETFPASPTISFIENSIKFQMTAIFLLPLLRVRMARLRLLRWSGDEREREIGAKVLTR